jgi:dolichyl-diphosphooligosaccharide--protein glycosyltransferase
LSQPPGFLSLHQEHGMNFNRLSPKLIIAILIAVIFGISLLFRIVLPHDQVFSNDWIKFTSIDAYFYQRVVDNTAFNFPHLMNFDPYFIYPGGRVLGDIFFPEWLIAGAAWLFGAGSPTQHTVDVVSVFFPAIFAALTVIPVYFIGRTLFNRWVGVIAAALTAIFPGESLGRTMLGVNDTPAAQILLTTTFMCFAILALKTARERQLTFVHILRRDWSKCLRLLIYSALAGLFLGLYLLSWQGALLFVFIFALYLVIQFVIDHLGRRSVDHLGIVGIVTFLVALIIFFNFSPGALYLVSLVLALLIPVALVVISRVMVGWKIRPFYYPVALVVIGGIAVGAFYLINPDLLTSMFSRFGIFAPSGATAATTVEMQPLLDPSSTGAFATIYGWGNFTTSFFLGPWWLVWGILGAALLSLCYRYYLQGNAAVSLLVFLVLTLVVICVLANTVLNSEVDIVAGAFPGLALVSLSILFYLFIRKNGARESYLRAVIFILAILAVIMAVLLLHGYGHRTMFLVPLVALFVLLFFPGGRQKKWLPFFVWTLVILALTLPQRRYAYYLVINIALLSAYVSWQIIRLADVRRLTVKPRGAPAAVPAGKAKARKKEARQEKPGFSTRFFSIALAGVAVFFLVFFPNVVMARDMATQQEASYAPSDAWVSSLLWMKENTPEPFGDPDAYYRQYQAPPPGESFQYPASAYSVTSWWDYGYWILQIAHRIPSANPSQEPEPIIKVANLFLSQDDAAATEIMDELRSSYLIAEYDTATMQLVRTATKAIFYGKFHAILTWAQKEQSKYYDVYYVPDTSQGQNNYIPALLFYPEYYRSLYTRLYNFNGEAVTDAKPWVITYETDDQGNRFITDSQEFTSYREALDYLDSQESGNHVIIGPSPFISPIPLEAVPDFQLVYSSSQGTSLSGVGFVPEVKIFEYTGR